jgi:hypothetical protein
VSSSEFKPATYDEVLDRWPKARFDLLAYARWARRHNDEVVAAQIELAVQLADTGFEVTGSDGR